jgi:hypothetical protein
MNPVILPIVLELYQCRQASAYSGSSKRGVGATAMLTTEFVRPDHTAQGPRFIGIRGGKPLRAAATGQNFMNNEHFPLRKPVTLPRSTCAPGIGSLHDVI